MARKVKLRSHGDGLNDVRSYESGAVCDPAGNMTRQEFSADADVNVLMRRHGVNVPTRRIEYGDMDFDVDLMSAYGAVADANRAWLALPDAVRARYPSPSAMLEAAGQQRLDLSVPLPPAEVPKVPEAGVQ